MKKVRFVIKGMLTIFLMIAISVFTYALVGESIRGEASIGSFDVSELNTGWTLTADDGGIIAEDIVLPYKAEKKHRSKVTLTNTLPADIKDGMHLCFRSKRQDVVIYVNGEVRADYRAENFYFKHRSPVSAYVLIDLYDSDALGTISLEVTSKDNTAENYSTVTYAYGNNVWFPFIQSNLTIVTAAVASIVTGILTIVGYILLRKKVENTKAVLYLAEMIIVMGFWILSESQIRQLYFKAPSLSNIFAFLLIETVAAFGSMYFNEVQGHRYEKVYIAFEVVIVLQVLVNTILNFTGLADYYDTLIFSHSMSAMVLLWTFFTMIVDIWKKRIKKYSITAWGMLLLILTGALELINFYYVSSFGLGVFLSMGLIILLGATILQTIVNNIRSADEHRRYSEKMTEMTFRTIASTIDAKDVYTGGHSERVGEYAGLILTEMMKKGFPETHGLSGADVDRIKYIGKMHDIGKIGVPDRVLNKSGRLTDEEYEIMKSHTLIGSEITSNMDTVEGLNDGVRHHHERYNGKGYPDGLKGREISLFARILCLADCYDAMTTDRVYRKRLTQQRVIDEIEKNKGQQFDPDVAETVLEMIKAGTLKSPKPTKEKRQ